MATDREREAEMDRLLRAALARTPAGTAEACPPADELSAYVERTLSAAEREALDSHLAACGRCQEALALMATMPETPETPATAPVPARSWWLAGWRRWLVPASALASAVILYVALKPAATLRPASPQESIAVTAPAPAPGGVTAPEPKGQVAADTAPPAAAGGPGKPGEAKDTPPMPRRSRENIADTLEAKAAAPAPLVAEVEPRKERVAAPVPQLAPAPVPAAPTPPPPVEALAEAQARETPRGAVGGVLAMRPAAKRSADASIAAPAEAASGGRGEGRQPTIVRGGGAFPFLWRFDPGARILGSTDEGRTWQLQHPGPGELTAGSAASAAICWAVGAEGLVLRTTDGRTWETVPFPERLDLVAISATSARHATVHDRNGRRFTTDDGGATWRER